MSRLFSFHRMMVISSSTFTQLVRMKVFYFLVVFVLAILVAHFFKLPHTSGPESSAHEELRMLKNATIGAMSLFATIFAITGTALLIPKDIEDRTLYSILSKPVPRLDYLAGKLLGIISVIFVAMFAMDLVMTGALELRSNKVMNEVLTSAAQQGYDAEATEAARQEVLRHGSTWSLQAGVLALFLKTVILASLALFFSTFSTSTLFTVIMSFVVFFIGHIVGDIREYLELMNNGETSIGSSLTKAVGIIIPDFALFNVTDEAIAGKTIPLSAALRLTLIAVVYAALYTVISWFIFADKEF